MKQLEKIGSQASRMLTDDQMKRIQGGDVVKEGCGASHPGMRCSTSEHCGMWGENGILLTGNCTVECRCNITGMFDPNVEI